MHCIGCGAVVADLDIPTHPYIGASPGCWAVYTQVIGREFGEFNYPDCHRVTVDAYSVQHPGTPSRQSIQSVAIHLIGLHLVLERNCDSKRATQALRSALAARDQFTWLDPPSVSDCMTVLDVANASDLSDHDQRVRAWAEQVWRAWAPHHDQIRQWAAGPSTTR